LEIPISSDFLECKEELVPEPGDQNYVEIKTVKRITLARISIECWFEHKKPTENDRFQLFFIQRGNLENVTSGFQPMSEWEVSLAEIKREEEESIAGPDKFETNLGAAFYEAFYFCIDNSHTDRHKVIIFASDLIESSSGSDLCQVFDEISRDFKSRDITYVLFLAIAAREDDYKRVNQCFKYEFPTKIFVPIVTNQGITFEHYDTVVEIAKSNEDYHLKNEELEMKLEKTSAERDECQNSINDQKTPTYQKTVSNSLIMALSVVLIVCSLGILLGVRRLL
jgi:hypothetical protein